MKLIHLSDLRIIDEEQPDAVLICGDVYDKSIPSAEAVTVFDDFLCRRSHPPRQASPRAAAWWASSPTWPN